MKKFLALLLLIGTTSSIAMADTPYYIPRTTTKSGGFYDSTAATKASVADTLKMRDNSYVRIQGNIVRQISGDKYLFKDSTGTITVEIDKNKWNGQNVNTKDTLELTGEIERDFRTIKLDVDTVNVLTK